MRGRLERFHTYAELGSFIFIILGVLFGFIEAESNWKRDRIETAEKVYREVDDKFATFIKMCLEHPRLDCQSKPNPMLTPELSPEEVLQQKAIYVALTDLFQVAYIQYFDKGGESTEVKQMYDKHWVVWDKYIRKFTIRPAYVATWRDVEDEHDARFARYIDGLLQSEK